MGLSKANIHEIKGILSLSKMLLLTLFYQRMKTNSNIMEILNNIILQLLSGEFIIVSGGAGKM